MQVAGVSQTVNVMGSSPVVDTQSAAGGVTIDQAMMNQLPVQRSFYNLARIAPGVTNDNVGASMLGSTGAENKYIIDGVDSTGIMAGQQKKTMLLDFIDQVNIKTEGTNAEIGGATGGVIEAITKSGSNSFHGSGFVLRPGRRSALRPTPPRRCGRRRPRRCRPSITRSTAAAPSAATSSRTSCGSSAATTRSTSRIWRP